MFPPQLSGQKQQIKLTLKGSALKRLEKPVLPQEDDSEWQGSAGEERMAGRGCDRVGQGEDRRTRQGRADEYGFGKGEEAG